MATKQIAWNTGSGNITLTYQGQGNGTITVASDDNNGAARSQVITVETLDGTKSVNLTVRQTACPIPVGTVLNYAYTGSYQEVELPAGQYKLQCWGAQGGSNGTNSSYRITAQPGGKGGYSEGVITLAQKTTLRIYVGGQGSASAGGYNGGGSTTGTAQYTYNNEFGYSKMGGGGGATDIRLSDGALLSRMLVAGGGGGGAMCYKSATSTVTKNVAITYEQNSWDIQNSYLYKMTDASYEYVRIRSNAIVPVTNGKTYNVSLNSGYYCFIFWCQDASGYCPSFIYSYFNAGDISTLTAKSGYMAVVIRKTNYSSISTSDNHGFALTYTEEETVISRNSQTGYVGGGTSGGGYSSTYQGRQNAAGSGGSFGQGANQTTTNYRYCSGAGGGGWYGGGGGQKSDSSMTYCKYSGGGSGWVNTSASAGNRPSGYTGLQLDSGTTYDGDTLFPAPSGSNETGHSGNGYARITRIS